LHSKLKFLTEFMKHRH